MPTAIKIVPWRDMVGDVRALAPGIPTAAAMKFLQDAAVWYCKRTAAWQEKLDALYIYPDVREYEINPPIGSDAVIELVTLIDGVSDFEFAPPHLIRLARTPAMEGWHEVYAALIPGPDSPGLGEQFWVSNRDGISHNAAARAYRLPGEAWSDLGLATYHESCAEEEVFKARISASRRNQASDMRARPRRFL